VGRPKKYPSQDRQALSARRRGRPARRHDPLPASGQLRGLRLAADVEGAWPRRPPDRARPCRAADAQLEHPRIDGGPRRPAKVAHRNVESRRKARWPLPRSTSSNTGRLPRLAEWARVLARPSSRSAWSHAPDEAPGRRIARPTELRLRRMRRTPQSWARSLACMPEHPCRVPISSRSRPLLVASLTATGCVAPACAGSTSVAACV
jgi:hypothetical protein